MFKTILIFVFTLVSTLVYSQDQNDLSRAARFNIGLHGVEAAYELPVSKKFVIDGAVGMGMGGYTNGGAANFLFDIIRPVPFAKTRFRYIYNRAKRESKGKGIARNSGNYIGLQAKYSFGNRLYSSLNRFLLSEVHWGIQRSRRKSIFNFHIGLGHLSDKDRRRSRLIPTLGIMWGWQVFKSKG